MSLRHLRSLAPLIALPVAMACGGGEAETAAPTRGLDGPDQTLTWDPPEVYRVGGFEAPDWASFGNVSALDFDSQGFLYVMDDQASTITKISPDGEFVATIGRPGEGPGELAQPLAMLVLADDRIAVADIGHRGFVIFDRDGSWVENVLVDMGTEGLPMEGLLAHPSGDIVSTPGLRMNVSDGGGRQSMSVGGGEDQGEPVHRYAMDASREGSDFYFAWEAPPPPDGGESELSGGDGGSRIMVQMRRMRAFTPDVDLAVLPDGRLVVADSTTYRIKLVDTETGEEVGSLERPIPPTTVDPGIEERERDRRLAEAQEGSSGRIRVLGSGGGGMSIDQDAMRRMMEDQIENMVFYPEIPVIEDIAVDSEGRIWVQRASGTPGQDGPTDVITADGRYHGTLPAAGLRIPRAFGPQGLVAVVETDEFDVPTIRVLRVPVS